MFISVQNTSILKEFSHSISNLCIFISLKRFKKFMFPVKQSLINLFNTDLINTGKNERVHLECGKTTMFQRIFRQDFLLCVHTAFET